MVDTPTGTDTPQSIEDRITAAMESDGPTGQPEDTPKEAREAAPEEAQEAAPEDESEDAPEEEQPDEPEEEEAEEADEPEGEEESEPEQVFTVTLDGREIKVDADELVKGYQRQSDYTRKTQELAEQRKAQEAEITQAQQQYAQALQTVEAFLESQGPQQPDPRLREVDPIEYLTQMEAYREHRERLQATKAERQWLQQQEQQKIAEERKNLVKQEEQRLLEVIPEWRNADVKSKETREIANFLKTAGYSDDEIGSISRSRDLLVARDAMKYRQLQAQKPKAEAKAKGKPKVAKPGTSQKTTPDFSKARQRVKKTGSVDDAAKAIGLMNLD